MSAPGLAVPPGRAGRLWLESRLGVARRGADLLERKLRILADELGRVRRSGIQTAREWDRCCADARQWLLRAALGGGERAIRLAGATEPAEVTVGYTVTMGARYPARAGCVTPEPAGWDGPVMASARTAHRRALEAAVHHAAALAAVRAVEAETAATRYRLRAISDRWIPRLEEALAAVIFDLEEQERADGARLRQAVRRRSAGR